MKFRIIKYFKINIRNIIIIIEHLLSLFPVKKRYYIFESFGGRDISDNPLAIYKQLVHDYPSSHNNAVFSVQPHLYNILHKQYPNIKMVKRLYPQWCLYMARAQFWIFNTRIPARWHKNKHTIYIQTWHGTPLKKLGVDITSVKMPGTTTDLYKKHFINETKRWNYLIAPNIYSEKIFKHAFKFKNHFLRIGYPRNDILYKNDNKRYIKNAKEQLVHNKNANVITYAPTWRDDDYIHKGAYKFSLKFNLDEFFKNVSSNTVLIIRPHYLIKSKICIPKKYVNRVFVMRKEDISKIYLITNLLITDYSSVMFDFANLGRPMLFFAYDLKYYKNTLRGFYFNYRRDIPGPIATDSNKLYNQLRIFNKFNGFPKYYNKIKKFRKYYCSWESSHSSKDVITLISRITCSYK